MKATGETLADQCRSIGLQIGDTIEGAEEPGETARLTLLWVGEEVAVFRVTELRSGATDWDMPIESADWDLTCRDWRLVEGGAA
jgi:hypothetical protein